MPPRKNNSFLPLGKKCPTGKHAALPSQTPKASLYVNYNKPCQRSTGQLPE